MKQNDFTEENFQLMRRNLQDFEDDVWALSHTAYCLNFCVMEAMHCHHDDAGIEKMNHLSWVIELMLESLLDLSDSTVLYLEHSLGYKLYNH